MPLSWAKSVSIFHNDALRVITPQTLTPNNVCDAVKPLLAQCWSTVADGGPTLNQQCVNVSWLLDICWDTGSGIRHVRWVEENSARGLQQRLNQSQTVFLRCHVTTAPSETDAMFSLTFNVCPSVLFICGRKVLHPDGSRVFFLGIVYVSCILFYDADSFHILLFIWYVTVVFPTSPLSCSFSKIIDFTSWLKLWHRVKWGYLGQFWVFSNFTLSLLDNMYI